MPRIEKITHPYVVSFNGTFDGTEVGEWWSNSADFGGDNIQELAEEVNQSDPTFPLTFMADDGPETGIIGFFYGGEEEPHPTAVMMTTEYFYQ